MLKGIYVFRILWTVALNIILHNETHFQNHSDLGIFVHFLYMKSPPSLYE